MVGFCILILYLIIIVVINYIVIALRHMA